MSKSRNNALEFSSVGSIIVDTAAGITAGNFGAIQVLQDATIGAVEGKAVDNIEKLQTEFPAGTIIYGVFTSVTVTDGLVALHRI